MIVHARSITSLELAITHMPRGALSAKMLGRKSFPRAGPLPLQTSSYSRSRQGKSNSTWGSRVDELFGPCAMPCDALAPCARPMPSNLQGAVPWMSPGCAEHLATYPGRSNSCNYKNYLIHCRPWSSRRHWHRALSGSPCRALTAGGRGAVSLPPWHAGKDG